MLIVSEGLGHDSTNERLSEVYMPEVAVNMHSVAVVFLVQW